MLHPRNKHRSPYIFKELIDSFPELSPFVKLNAYGNESIDFSNPLAVTALNKSLLSNFYGIKDWQIPKAYLCPPIPGRVDYIHHIADLLGGSNAGKIPKGEQIRCLDIGVGASCIYPLLGNKEYGWSFVGCDVDLVALESARRNLKKNFLSGNFDFRIQQESKDIYKGVIQENEYFDLSISNPPFHSSAEEAKKGTLRKLKNLKGKKANKLELNFGGKANELWYEGGEKQFIHSMIRESLHHAKNCFWFTTLVSRESRLKSIYAELKKVHPNEVKTINMGQGNKTSRIVAWTFLTAKERKDWIEKRWRNS